MGRSASFFPAYCSSTYVGATARYFSDCLLRSLFHRRAPQSTMHHWCLLLLCYKQSEASSAAKRTTRQLFEQRPGDFDANCSDGIWMMTLSAYAANRGVQTGTEVSRCVAPVDRLVQRGKNDFFPQRGSRRRRYIAWRDDEILASLALRNGPVPVLVSAPRSHVR